MTMTTPSRGVVIEWSGQPQAPGKDRSWSKSLRLLQRILLATLTTSGKDLRPFADGPTVRACDLELVKAEFIKQYVTADGTPKQRADARRRAFQRAVATAQGKDLVATREVVGTAYVWLVSPTGETP